MAAPQESIRRAASSSPRAIEVRGARVNNLADVDVDVPLGQLVAIAGVSGSGKSSLALGVLYAEGSRRYVEALSTYTRRRMTHAPRAAVDSVRHVPAALVLRQRPQAGGVRSTFGTSTELLNVLRVMYSRLGSHLCPNGHRLSPTIDVAANLDLTCPVCAAVFYPPGAETFAFNSDGACSTCSGTGVVRDVDDQRLVPDTSRSIADGAVAPWGMFGLAVMPQVAEALGVRIDVPYAELSDSERHTVLDGPAVKRQITVPSKSGKLFDLNFTYRSARQAVREAMNKATSEQGLARVNRFITAGTCPACHGTRLSEAARGTHVAGIDLAQATAQTLDEVVVWAPSVVPDLPSEMHSMARMIVEQLTDTARRLVQLGLGYLTLDRATTTLSTGERQRVQLARAVRNQTSGVLYVLDEPSIGLHPVNIAGLVGVMDDLLEDGNSVLLVDHDVQVLREADWIIEIGPGSGADGGHVIATGPVAEVAADPRSVIGGYLSAAQPTLVRDRVPADQVFTDGAVTISTSPIHTVHALQASVPKNRLTAVTGMSGSGKTTLILESLVPALAARYQGDDLPSHVRSLETAGIDRVDVVDATPIGTNIRSTIATYAGVLDDLRRSFAQLDAAKERGLKGADFSYNTGSLRCPRCEGTGQVVLDVQFLPDVDIPCPTCQGSRYCPAAAEIELATAVGPMSLPRLLALPVVEAAAALSRLPRIHAKLTTLVDLGLGYLSLGETTTALSGGEAQRLKLAAELPRNQAGTLFVMDEPSVGLHPQDVRVLLSVIDRLLGAGATVIVIEHDLDVIANADHIIDLGPGGGAAGGHIVATGTPEQVAEDPRSVTGVYLGQMLARRR
jgi:excinuclease ABC subunit A